MHNAQPTAAGHDNCDTLPCFVASAAAAAAVVVEQVGTVRRPRSRKHTAVEQALLRSGCRHWTASRSTFPGQHPAGC